MSKTILITGSTDGIGLLTAKMLAEAGHTVLLHGRSEEKLVAASNEVGGKNKIYRADLTDMKDVQVLADAAEWIDYLPDGCALYDYSGRLVMPGFIDTHCHYPQTEMIASYGLQLLDWLRQYTFPTESKFAEREYADKIAELLELGPPRSLFPPHQPNGAGNIFFPKVAGFYVGAN